MPSTSERPPTPSGIAPTEALPAHYRRNFLCLAADFGLFGLGMAFLGSGTVMPSFLTTLGASASLIGFLSTMQRAGWLLPQLPTARYLTNQPLKKPYILTAAAISRLSLLVLAILVATLVQYPNLLVGITCLVLAVFWMGDGVASTGWFDVLSKAIPPQRRGRLTSTGQILSGVLGFVAGGIVETILSERGPRFPINYALLFLLAFVCLVGSFIAISLIVERPSTTSSKMPSWREYGPQLWHLLREDHHFRTYLVARQIFGLSGLALPFYMTYALERLHLPAHVSGRYTSMGVIGSIIAAAVFGWLNEHHGTKRAAIVSIFITAAVPLLALLIPRVIRAEATLAWAYGLVFFAMNASMSCYLPAWTAYVLEWAPEAQRPQYVGLTNTLSGITAIFSTLGGLILQWSGENYTLLFTITALGTLLAVPFTARIPEPRLVKHQDNQPPSRAEVFALGEEP